MSDDKSRKTEQPTPRKLRESRKKGQVPHSKEIVSTLMLVAAALYFWIAWDWLVDNLTEMITMPANLYGFEFREALSLLLDMLIEKAFFVIAIPFAALLFVTGVIANIMHVGLIFATEPLAPKMEKLNPVSGLKRMFSMKSVVTTALSAVKITLISVILFIVISGRLGDIIHDVSVCNTLCLKALFQNIVQRLMVFIIPLFLFLMIIDFIISRAQYLKDQMMTKEELKRDYKEQEGDPLLKGQLRRTQREVLMDDMEEKIRSSRVVVADVNVAIALRYDKGDTPLPIIMAIGKGAMATQMIRVANKEEVPVVTHPKLAWRLADDGVIDQYIPESTIQQAARVLQRVM